MTNNAVVDAVGGLPASVVIAWIAGIVALFGIAWVIGKRIYKAIEAYRKKRNAIEEEHETFENMQTKDVEIENSIKMLTERISEEITLIKTQNEQTRETLRYLIGSNLEKEFLECIRLGYRPKEKVHFYDKMFENYNGVLNGNSYIEDLYNEVKKLPIKCFND